MVDKNFYNRLDEFIDSLSDKKNDYKILSFVLEELDEIPVEVKSYIVEKIDIFPSTLEGTLKFYPKFKDKSMNYVVVCQGRVCKNSGKKIYDELKRYIDSDFQLSDKKIVLSESGCLGKCNVGPNVSINGKIYGYKNIEDIIKILKKL